MVCVYHFVHIKLSRSFSRILTHNVENNKNLKRKFTDISTLKRIKSVLLIYIRNFILYRHKKQTIGSCYGNNFHPIVYYK